MDNQSSKGDEDSSDFEGLPIIPSDELSASLVATSTTVVFPYLFRLAAFHFAQRARWAAAIRLRAAADMVLRFLTSVQARPTLPTVPRKPPRLPRAFKASSSCSTLLRA